MPSGYTAGTGVTGPPSERGVDRLNRSLSSGLAISPKMRAVETPLVVRSDNEDGKEGVDGSSPSEGLH
jgi:hypothetical protein